MMGVPLDFEPGTQQAYSNFGYCVLGRIVETTLATKTNKRISYEEFVRSAVLKPAGISDMRIGGTRLAERARREVRYYHQKNQSELPFLAPSVCPGEEDVPWAYGGYYIRALDSHGGWIGSAEDLLNLA
jgi:N-acyl-D-amino-acid deacylase